jgi:protein SCO1/2
MESNSQMVRWVVWGGLAVVILAVLFAFVREQRAPDSSPADPGLPVISQLTDFTLTNQLAKPVGLAKFADKVWFADIIFTRCPGPCPVMTKRMAELQAHFVGEPNVAFATLTTDPGHDTPTVMQRFAKRFGADAGRWQFLTGAKPEIVRLAVDEMKLIAREKPPGEQTTPEDLFIHATIFVVIDRQGRLRGVLESMEDGWKEKAIAIAHTLLNEASK